MANTIAVFGLALSLLASSGLSRGSAATPDVKTFAYRAGGGATFSLDVYGAASGPRHPALIFFHGGGWKGGNKKQFDRQAKDLTARTPLIVVSADYPLDGDPVEATKAAASAICWVKAHAGALDIDPDRIALSGGSAGGQLAATVALTKATLAPQCDGVAAPYGEMLILFNPVLELKGKWERALGRPLGQVSPIEMLDRAPPPTLIMQGDADLVAPPAIARAFVEKAEALGQKRAKLITFPGRQHGFFNSAQTGDLQATVDDTIAFMRSNGWF